MMKEEEKTKKSNKKWILAIVLIAVIAVVLVFYFEIFSLPTGFVTASKETVIGNQNTSATTPATQQPITTVTGKEIISTAAKENLPYYESADLEPGGYAIQVATDKPVWINVYDESHFNDWKNNGYYGTAITGTGSRREQYQTTAFSDRFYVSSDGKGKYYIVIEGSGEVSINLKLVQTFKY